MRIKTLNYLDSLFSEIGINYRFQEWEEASVPDPFFTGSYVDSTTETHEEDGSVESTFTLVGVSTSWLKLETAKEKLININRTAAFENVSVAVYYNNSQPLPMEDERLKRLQIQLTVKEWGA